MTLTSVPIKIWMIKGGLICRMFILVLSHPICEVQSQKIKTFLIVIVELLMPFKIPIGAVIVAPLGTIMCKGPTVS